MLNQIAHKAMTRVAPSLHEAERRMQKLPQPDELGFRSAHVVAMSGLSLRQIQWWDERGLVRPKIHHHARYYSPAQTALVLILAELRRRNFSLQQLRRLRPEIERAITEMSVTGPFQRFTWLATDGRRVRLVDSLDMLAARFQGGVVSIVGLRAILTMVGL